MSWTFPTIDNPLTNQIAENNMTTKEKYVMYQNVIAKEMTQFFDHRLVDLPKMSTVCNEVLAHLASLQNVLLELGGICVGTGVGNDSGTLEETCSVNEPVTDKRSPGGIASLLTIDLVIFGATSVNKFSNLCDVIQNYW